MKYLIIAALTLTSVLIAHGQERILSAAEFNEISFKAEKGLTTGVRGSYRLLLETDIMTEGLPNQNYRLRSLSLLVPGRGVQRTEERVVGGQTSKSEVIVLNDRSFSRGPDGKWIQLERKAAGSPTEPKPRPEAQTIKEDAEYKFLGTETYAGRQVQIYRKTERKIMAFPDGTNRGSELSVILRTSIEGDYYRYESNSTTVNGDRRGTIKIVTEMYTDPTISLRPPEGFN